MEIAIVGAGVLGSIFGSLFSEKGFSVTLIEVLKERVHLIDEVAGRQEKPRADPHHIECKRGRR